MATRKTTAGTTKKADVPAPPLKIVEAAEPTAGGEDNRADQLVLRKKELFERVTAATGARKRDVKLIVEATLDVVGAALSAGEVLALPPLGKAQVNRRKDLASGEMLVIKLRRNRPGGKQDGGADDPLAEQDE